MNNQATSNKHTIYTLSAPEAIGAYSQAIKIDNTVYVSGQIGLDPKTMKMVSDDFAEQCHQVFKNLAAIAEAAGATIDNFAKFTVYFLDLDQFSLFNTIMAEHVGHPYPARAAVQVSRLPKDAKVEIDGIIILN